jgi:hypothetical protein
VWAVGILLYDMISRGDRALDRMDPVQAEGAVLTKTFPPKQPLAPHEYRALEALMRKCLAFNPANRPSASQLVAELKAIMPKGSSGLFALNSA